MMTIGCGTASGSEQRGLVQLGHIGANRHLWLGRHIAVFPLHACDVTPDLSEDLVQTAVARGEAVQLSLAEECVATIRATAERAATCAGRGHDNPARGGERTDQ